MVKLKLALALVTALTLSFAAATPADAMFEALKGTKGITENGSVTSGVDGVTVTCGTASGTWYVGDSKTNFFQDATKTGPHLIIGGERWLECKSSVFATQELWGPYLQIIQHTKNSNTSLPISFVEPLFLKATSCEITGPPELNSELKSAKLENLEGGSLHVTTELSGITYTATGAGCALAGIKSGKEGTLKFPKVIAKEVKAI